MQLNDRELFQQSAFIGGQWRGVQSGATDSIHNPATGEVLGAVPHMGADETRDAIQAAQTALASWSALTARKRSEILLRWYALMLEHRDDLARIITLEQGKPLPEATGEITYAASFLQWFAEEAKRAYGDCIPSPQSDARLMVIKQPIGVCAAITPWNFPSAMITRKAAAALAAGCTMVIKPAPQTPFSALALMVLAERAGVPAGVLSVITGDAVAIGQELTSNPIVRKLSFTGSTQTGRLLLSQCANTVKRTSMELGGNAPFIVFEDADIEAAVAGALAAKYRNSGQTCVCVNRFYIHADVYDEFVQRFSSAVQQLRMGNGLDKDVQLGPLIDQRAVNKVQRHIQDALDRGARVLCGGEVSEGTFFPATVLADVAPDALLTQEETFGPVSGLIRFHDERKVIELANNTEYGLAAYFYSRDIGRCFRVSEALEYGMIGVNSGLISNEVAPFGGVKASGMGREGSRYGLDEYLEIKYINFGGLA